MPRTRSARLIAHLGDRPDLGRDEAIRLIGSELPATDVSELADLLELELGLPLGFLRPDDDLQRLLAPFELRNPFTWLWAEAALEDGISEINYQLKRRAAKLERSPRTVRELFEVWCGKPAA